MSSTTCNTKPCNTKTSDSVSKTDSAATSISDATHQPTNWGATLAVWIMRLWLSMRVIVAGIEKFATSADSTSPITIDGSVNTYGLTDAATNKTYSFDAYQGVPAALINKFQNQPLIPETLLNLFDKTLGPALFILGFMLLFGIASRISLFIMGLLFTALTFGMVIVGQDSGIAWLGVHVIIVVLMLLNIQHNKICVLKKF